MICGRGANTHTRQTLKWFLMVVQSREWAAARREPTMFEPNEPCSDIGEHPHRDISWASIFMVEFTLVQTGSYHTFVKQCLSNSAHLGNHDACPLVGRNQAKSKRRRWRQRSQPRRQAGRGQGANKKENSDTSGRHFEGPLARAISWEWLARVHFYSITCVYLYILLKYLLIELVSYEASSLAYLDCLVVGRFRFIGRTNMISGEIACVFIFVFLVNRWTIHLCMPKFKFYALEFMLHRCEQVKLSELKFGQDKSSQAKSESRRSPAPSYKRLNQCQPGESCFGHSGTTMRGGLPGRKSSTQVNSCFYLRGPFELSDTPNWILRPNRTEASWHVLNLWTKVLFYFSSLTVVAWMLLIYWALAGSVLTVLGFEISYPACVAWIRSLHSNAPQMGQSAANNNDNNNTADYSHIYRAPKVMAHEMRIDDIPARISLDSLDFQQVGAYYVARVAADMLENTFVYLEFIFQFVGQFYALVINSLDVVLNAQEIRRRLERLLIELEERARHNQLHDTKAEYYSKILEAHNDGNLTSDHARSASVECSQFRHSVSYLTHGLSDSEHQPRRFQQTSSSGAMSDDQLGVEIAHLQAILADHFDTLTRGYNLYISFFVTFLLIIWASYTAVVCTWLGTIKSQAIEFEFMIVETGGTLFTVTFLSSVAIVRAQNIRLYPLIARAMALDPDWSLTKPRWITILSYYSPRSLYCFTIFGTAELSWLLCLKLVSWVLSAFIVLANFYYMNRT